MPQPSSHTPAVDPSPVAPAGWDRDPLVAVSRRTRNIAFPSALLMRAPTDADADAWETPQGEHFAAQYNAISRRNDRVLTLEAGVTFLGCYTTAWTLRAASAPSMVPKDPPSLDSCILVSPGSSARDIVLGTRSPFMDHGAKRIDARLVRLAWERVLAYLRASEDRAHARDPSAQRLFTTDDGFDHPEVVVCKLSDLLGLLTPEARAVHPYMTEAIPWAKNPEHLGALHDYAVRLHGGWVVATECRKRAQSAPALATTIGR